MCISDENFDKRLNSFTLYEYAAKYWGLHARSILLKEKTLILNFLKHEANMSASVQTLLASTYRDIMIPSSTK